MPQNSETLNKSITHQPSVNASSGGASSAAVPAPPDPTPNSARDPQRDASALHLMRTLGATPLLLPNGRWRATLPPLPGSGSSRSTSTTTADFADPADALESLAADLAAASERNARTDLLAFLSAWSHGTYTPYPRLNTDSDSPAHGQVEWWVRRVADGVDVTGPFAGPLNALQEIMNLMTGQ